VDNVIGLKIAFTRSLEADHKLQYFKWTLCKKISRVGLMVNSSLAVSQACMTSELQSHVDSKTMPNIKNLARPNLDTVLCFNDRQSFVSSH